LEPLPVANELFWAGHWLTGYAAQINRHRQVASEVQALLFGGELTSARAKLDLYVQKVGWSLWAVELRAALLQMAEGTNAQRAWLAELQAKTLNSIPGLLFQIFGDRNDDTFSYDAVYSKCMNSFPRFDSLAPWLVDYLKYRTLAHVEDPLTALPGVLSRDITSSLIDYYESVVDTLAYVAYDKRLEDLRPAASSLILTLLSDGYEDYRLRKMLLALDPILREVGSPYIEAEPDETFKVAYLRTPTKSNSSLLDAVVGDLRQCQEKGTEAYDVVGKLLKWGLNLKGLDIGTALALSALQATARSLQETVLPFRTTFLSESVCVDDAAALSVKAGSTLLRAYLTQQGSDADLEGDKLWKLSSWPWREVLPNAGPIHLWMAQRLLERNEFEELAELLLFLRGQGPYWERQCAKLDVVVQSRQGRVDEGIKLLDAWFRRNSTYAHEFPGDILFEGRKWNAFKGLDPVEVGLVAHYTFEATGFTSVGYICKMACRKFLLTGMRGGIAADFQHASVLRKAQLVAFLRDVWIEQNLAMCHQFESTAEVRVERMSALQFLLSWEQERATDYADAIKDLTFEQTLQQGLERIDQTRVFVNESAITRWAEKELVQDFERWRKLSESNSGGRAIDDMLRQYALDPTNFEILMEFADGKPTAADALLIDILDRLFKRFLLDPTDGLDTYLSVRIRHGSLRGTILGPLEEQGLLYSATGFSAESFKLRWSDSLGLPRADSERLLAVMQEFSKDIRALVDEFVEQRVQVIRPEKPDGAFAQVVSPMFAKLLAASLAERPPAFYAFLSVSYFLFWKLVEVGLAQLREFVSDDLAEALRNRVEKLMLDIRALGHRYLPLITTLTTVSTTTKSQCDTVAEWFRVPSMVSGERYQLPDAIEIASAATKNVHRMFPANVQILCLPAVPLPLTTSGLAVLMDCLFVVFENAWKHSGLGADLPPIKLLAEFDPNSKLLTFEAHSSLSPERLGELLGGELSRLRAKYLGELPLELISLEGGSGFPKLARLTSSVPREVCAQPFDFGVEDGEWYTRLTVPLYEREGAFEAYDE
jgi:hypothetical protein